MHFPKELAVQAIEKRNVYRDEHSKEASTNVVKRKYKLAGNRFPGDGGVLFWIYTSKEETYPKDRTVVFTISDYHWCKQRQLRTSPSRVCIDKVDYHTEEEIASKIQHHENGFQKVAILRKEAFQKLAGMTGKVRLSNKNSVEIMQQIVRATVDTDEQYESILGRMGL